MNDWTGDLVYPTMIDIPQKKYLLKLLKEHIEKLNIDNDSEAHREACSLQVLLDSLTDNKGEPKAAMTILLANYRSRTRTKDVKHGILRVSERKFCIVEMDIIVGVVKHKKITSNMNYHDAEQLYWCLVDGREVSEKHRKFLLTP